MLTANNPTLVGVPTVLETCCLATSYLVGSGNVAVQETLVSGPNIKTLNSTSLLGSGNIVLAATPSGVAGAIQFSNGSAFASDAANFFWDDTNNRLGVGTNAPIGIVSINPATNFTTTSANQIRIGEPTNNVGYYFNLGYFISGGTYKSVIQSFQGTGGDLLLNPNGGNIGIGLASPTARTHIQGSGSTSATTSLLVQNSAGTESFRISDNGNVLIAANGFYSGGNGSNINSGLKLFNGSDGSLEIVQDWSPGFNSATLGGINFYTNGSIQQRINSKGNVLFGTVTENASAKVLIESTTQGFLPPRMTTTQRNNIASPAAGLMIYNTTTNKLNVYTTAWEAITSI